MNKPLLGRNQILDRVREDPTQNGNYLDVVKAMARLTYQSIYVIDYDRMKFEYVSENPLFLCGHTAQEVTEMSYEFYYSHVPPADLALLDLINNAGFDFYEQIPLTENRKEYTIYYDFHLIDIRGNCLLVNHKLTPLFLTDDGKIWKALCVVSLSNNRQSGNVMIYKEGVNFVWCYDIEKQIWLTKPKHKLSNRALQILQLYAQGLSIKQIANRLFISPDTVKYHRRKIFEELGVRHVDEALFYATNAKLL